MGCLILLYAMAEASRRVTLSPPLFCIGDRPVAKILKIAAESGALSKLGNHSPILRILLYANDAALFVKPKKRKLRQLSVC